MSNKNNNAQSKEAAMSLINNINAVEGFDPAPLAVEYGNLNEGSKRYRLPVMTQMAWFRLKYPEGKISVSVKPVKDYFVAKARVYAHYKDPVDCYLAEASASRGQVADKPTVSPREWAQTAAIGMALRNAGFGLQFSVAGESFEENALNEFSLSESQDALTADNAEALLAEEEINSSSIETQSDKTVQLHVLPQTEKTPLETAMAALCPIAKYSGKTLGEMLRIDPSAVAYVEKNGSKYGEELAGFARLICENALQNVAS
jgi:hypothetical protein